MSEDALTGQVIRIITEQQKLAPGAVSADSSFEQLGIDSLDGITLLFAFEEEFDITIPEQAAQQMKSVAQAVAGLREILAKRDATTG